MSNVMTISKRTASGLEEVLRTLLLDAESKVPADRLRIVGAMSDGAIIEQGSNANGDWVRLANGTQWCWSPEITVPATTSLSQDVVATWTLPAIFAVTPVTTVSFLRSSGGSFAPIAAIYKNGLIVQSGTGSVMIRCFTYTDTFVLDAIARAIAIGKWK